MPYCIMYDSEYGESLEECVMCCLKSLCLDCQELSPMLCCYLVIGMNCCGNVCGVHLL